MANRDREIRWTRDDYDALRAAIESGLLVVEYKGEPARAVSFDDVESMIEALGRIHLALVYQQRDAWMRAAELLANLKKDKHTRGCSLSSRGNACTCGLHDAWKAMQDARDMDIDE